MVDTHDIGQVVLVGHAVQPFCFFCLADLRVLVLDGQHSNDLLSRLGCNRHLRDRLIGLKTVVRQEQVAAETGQVTSDHRALAPARLGEMQGRAKAMPLVEIEVVGAVEAIDVHAQLVQQATRGRREFTGFNQGLAAAVSNQLRAVYIEFVSLGVPAEVIVVVENQDPGIGLFLPVEPGRRQAADATTDDNQVVLAGIRRPAEVRTAAHGEGVGNVEGTIVIATHTHQGGRIIRSEAFAGPECRWCGGRQREGPDAMKQVSSSDRGLHSEGFVVAGRGHKASGQRGVIVLFRRNRQLPRLYA